jgi:hypothetical protein
MGIGMQQAAEQAGEFRIAAAVDLLRITESGKGSRAVADS